MNNHIIHIPYHTDINKITIVVYEVGVLEHLFVTPALCQATAVNRVNLVCCRVSDTLLNAQVGSAATLLSTHTVNLSTFVSIIACFLTEIEIWEKRTLLARHTANPCPFQFLLKCQEPALEYPSRIVHSSTRAEWDVLTQTQHKDVCFSPLFLQCSLMLMLLSFVPTFAFTFIQ